MANLATARMHSIASIPQKLTTFHTAHSTSATCFRLRSLWIRRSISTMYPTSLSSSSSSSSSRPVLLQSSSSCSHSIMVKNNNKHLYHRNQFSTCSKLQQVEKIQLDKKITIPKDPYLMSAKVVKFASNQKLDQAITLVMESPVSRQNEVVWNHLIQESARIQKGNQSWKLLNEMKKRGFSPNSRTYTILLQALAANPHSPNTVSRAIELYKSMSENDEDPTIIHTNALLKVCSQKKDLESLKKVYSWIPLSGPNAADVVTFTTTINGLVRNHRKNSSEIYAGLRGNLKPKARTNHVADDRGFEDAWNVWQDFCRARISRPEEVEMDERLIQSILLACKSAASEKYIKYGYGILQELYGLDLTMIDKRTRGKPTTTKTNKYEGSKPISGQVEKGLGLGIRMGTPDPRTIEIAFGLCQKLEDYGRGQTLMDQVLKKFPDFEPDAQLFGSLMRLQVAAKQYEQGLSTWDRMRNLGIEPTHELYQQGLAAAAKCRNWERTKKIYKDFRQALAENRSDLQYQDTATLLSVVTCAAKNKEPRQALDILREADWTRVVEKNEELYPEFNVQLAQKASRVLVKVIKATVSQPKGSYDEGEVEKMAEELKVAKAMIHDLEGKLEAHDRTRWERINARNKENQAAAITADEETIGTEEAAFVNNPGGWREVNEDDDKSGYSKVGTESGVDQENAQFDQKMVPTKKYSSSSKPGSKFSNPSKSSWSSSSARQATAPTTGTSYRSNSSSSGRTSFKSNTSSPPSRFKRDSRDEARPSRESRSFQRTFI